MDYSDWTITRDIEQALNCHSIQKYTLDILQKVQIIRYVEESLEVMEHRLSIVFNSQFSVIRFDNTMLVSQINMVRKGMNLIE